MSGQITVPLPTMLTVDTRYEWTENGDPEYAWYIVFSIGDTEVGRIFYSDHRMKKPTVAEMERIAADTLRSILFPEILDIN